MYLLGFDIGSSSVKASLVDVKTGKCVITSHYPKTEAPIQSARRGWAEQNPEDWWEYIKHATHDVMHPYGVSASDISSVGISYQMHGLVLLDKEGGVIRPSIIWCDSRAVPHGDRAFQELGSDFCLTHLLNSPGNFTASKLAWVRENEPENFARIHKFMLPGDYVAYRMTGEMQTTVSGLSEMMLWDFRENRVGEELLSFYGIDKSLVPDIVPTFGIQGRMTHQAAQELGLRSGIPISYRAGDQPNNALSLNVFNPGEVASTAGTSGVVYGVLGDVNYDSLSRVNNFAHVNHTADNIRLGVLLCINGTGILYSWIKRTFANNSNYNQMNSLAASVPIGSEGLCILPFGNGAERMLQNSEIGSSIHGINFNTHGKAHLVRAVQEGIVFSFAYGMEIMQKMGMELNTIHAGHSNMFLSSVFRDALAGVSGSTIELYDTDGSIGAARASGIGTGVYADNNEAFSTLKKIMVVEPNSATEAEYKEAYEHWKSILKMYI